MKAAVYCGTRNIYGDMVTAAKSLIANSDVEKIFFAIEDDVFPEPLPARVETINVRGQTIFPPGGPNYSQRWTYMVLMRAALTKILPAELDTVLSLDTDTIVDKDISELWDLDLGEHYFAAAREPRKSAGGDWYVRPLYVNVGVALFNLRQLRQDGMDGRIIRALNTKSYDFNEQDCLNEQCEGRILTISSDYNANDYTEPARETKIIHYAARGDWRNEEIVQKYRAMTWEEAEQCRST